MKKKQILQQVSKVSDFNPLRFPQIIRLTLPNFRIQLEIESWKFSRNWKIRCSVLGEVYHILKLKSQCGQINEKKFLFLQ